MQTNEDQLVKLVPLLEQVLVRVGAQRTPTGAQLRLTNLQLGVLSSLARNDQCTLSELATDRMVVVPEISRLVKTMVTKGYVEKITDRTDKRISRLSLTPRGRAIMQAVYKEAIELLSKVLEKMSPDEQNALINGLSAFVRTTNQF